MRPCVRTPLQIRSVAFGGAAPLFCVPLVAPNAGSLLDQARIAHAVNADLIEWRADSYAEIDAPALVDALGQLRRAVGETPIIFTLRAQAEGGARPIAQDIRSQCVDAVMHSRLADIVDLELSNGSEFLTPLLERAAAHQVRIILSYHDFESTPSGEFMLDTIGATVRAGADIAKIACMPRQPGDVLRLMQATLDARKAFPSMPLCATSMGALGSVSRVAGFLFGSDMAFAVGQTASAPGQIPIAEARALAAGLLRFS